MKENNDTQKYPELLFHHSNANKSCYLTFPLSNSYGSLHHKNNEQTEININNAIKLSTGMALRALKQSLFIRPFTQCILYGFIYIHTHVIL